MRLRSTLTTLSLLFVFALHLHGQNEPPKKSYILELSGACSPGEMSVEFFIAGAFGGYSSFIKTDSRFSRYDIPTVRYGMPATSLKLMIRGARCRTQILDIPDLAKSESVIRTRLRRSRTIEFRGKIRSPERLAKNERWLTVEYWAHWKCEFLGLPDCMIGPNRIDAVDVGADGRFKVRLPDVANDGALFRFADRGAFEFFIRDPKTGDILYNLRSAISRKGSFAVPVAIEYPQDIEFELERYR
ncbi:MAG TPA: hypothetical protein PLP21_08340 [Pyrinomonadaceae bacterium]|nr:hypothetical protein [Pyrinomonadaceae bacterium]